MSFQVDNINTKSNELFEQTYIGLRSAEKRIYTDEEVAKLPEADDENIYKSEWKVRKASSQRLVCYLKNKRRPLKIMEVGCGNGWLSNQLSKIPDSTVIGIDINSTEVMQAKRVFAETSNLSFVDGDLNSVSEKFDIIVFAASVQYFESFKLIIENALEQLNEGGEIHILDTHFYKISELNQAKKRSEMYFKNMGFESMSEFYFHHSLDEVRHFNYSVLYNPTSIINKIAGNRNPFFWISIKK